MSNEIYGFADLPECTERTSILDRLLEITPLGVFATTVDKLVGFPLELRPNQNSLVFVIGDSPNSRNAEYLLDYQNYDSQASLTLPHNASERLSLLTRILMVLFKEMKCQRIVVGLTVCNQLDSVKHLKASQMSQVFNDDCLIESPPCIIYVMAP